MVGRHPKVAYDSQIQSIQEGGLRVMDLEERTKTNLLSWVKRIIHSPDSSSVESILAMTSAQDILMLLGSKGLLPPFSSPISPFYSQVLTLWRKVHNVPPLDEQGIRSELLWGNTRISSRHAMLDARSWQRWIQAGIHLVQHLCHPQEGRLLGQEEV